MHNAHLEMIRDEVLSVWGQQVFMLFSNDGAQETALRYLLGEIDHCFVCGDLSFEEAAEFYNLLDLPPERARMFPQKHLRGS